NGGSFEPPFFFVDRIGRLSGLLFPLADHLHLLDDDVRLTDRGGVDQHAFQRGGTRARFVGVFHRGEDGFGAFHFFRGRRVDLVGECDLAWMDRPFAFAAEDGGAVGLHAEAVRVAVIAEWAVYRHQAVRAR